MASFEAHIQQVKHNLSTLQEVNQKINGVLDWQVTICFYSAVHLINSYLAKEADLHYQKHSEVDNAINPLTITSIYKLSEDLYLNYEKLNNLSRKSRYLCNDDAKLRKKDKERAFFIHDRNFAKAIRNLDSLLSYFDNKYKIGFKKDYKINCKEFTVNTQLNYFTINPSIEK